MIIEKKALIKENYHYHLVYFESARQALGNVLTELCKEDVTLFLPAYIGWSSREGSGIYDPVISAGIKYKFYPLDEHINISLNDLQSLLEQEKGNKAVLLVDYFGFVDKNYDKVIKIIRQHGSYIIEDAAHAFFTDYVDRRCGRNADVVLYSLHKLFPLQYGGMAKICHDFFVKFQMKKFIADINPFEYQFDDIAARRKQNALEIEKNLANESCFEFLRKMEEYPECTPQTVPIIIHGHDKSDLYFRMNEMGYGVVSLYHTMIEPIREKFPQAVEIGNSILNLPVHQDINKFEIKEMCKLLISLCQTTV